MSLRKLSEQLNFVSMYHVASGSDGGGQRAIWANELVRVTTAPRRVEVAPNSAAHGVAIFNSDRALQARIIDWLEETL